MTTIAMRIKGGHPPKVYPFRIVDKKGVITWVEINSTIITWKDRPATLNVLRDINLRKQMEVHLRRSNWALTERIKELTCLYRIIRVIQSAESVHELGPKVVEQLVIAMQYPELTATIVEIDHTTYQNELYREGLQHGIHAKIHSGNQSIGRVSVYYTSKRDFIIPEEQAMINAVADSIGGWHERKQALSAIEHHSKHLEQVVREQTEKLRDADRLKAIGETALMIGHDLRNPLQVITNSLFLAKQRLEALPASVKNLAGISGMIKLRASLARQVTYMEKIVSDLQNFAKPFEVSTTPTKLHAFISETLSSITIPKPIRVKTTINPKLTVMLDGTMMKRVFINLITNAVQAMPKGGTVTITAIKSNETVSISVEDTGIGISDEHRKRIFQPLFTTKAKGLGMGLAACKRIAEAHDGTITVESIEGKGSTFTVTLQTNSP